MARFDELEAFVAVVDFAGFGNAADRLGIAKSMVSRRVSQLEKRLGVQLLQRTTRRQTLTDSGREFYQRATQLIADLNEAEQLVADADCDLSGRIRLSLPLGFGVSQLARPISDFIRTHPDIELDIDLNDRQVDLIAENIDLAIRVGDLSDSSLIARKLASVNFAICASPDYLARQGEPLNADDLAQHEVLVYSNVAAGKQWALGDSPAGARPRIRYRLTANNGEFLAAVACRGVAIVSGPLALLRPFIDNGDLRQILVSRVRPAAGMYAVYPPGRLIPRRVRMLSDALAEYLADRPM